MTMSVCTHNLYHGQGATNLYLLASYDKMAKGQRAAVNVTHPNSGTKEQVAGLIDQRLALRRHRTNQVQ